MKIKLSKRTRLILALLLVLAVAAWSLWGQDAASVPDGYELPTQSSTVESLPETAQSQLTGGAATDESDLTGVPPDAPTQSEAEEPLSALPDEDGSYTTKEDVALYLHTYGHLPYNFMTKAEARELGWEGGSLEPYAKGMCIGGDRFGNYEGLLPEKDGRSYTECDIDTLGRDSRGARRIVFSNDGLIYYTDDHYESFELLYGEEDA